MKRDGHLFSYEVYSSNRKIKTAYKDGKFKFTVTRNIEGRLSEDWNPNEDSFKDSYIKSIEKTVEKRVHETVTSFITEKLQKEIKADVTGLGTRSEFIILKSGKRFQENGMMIISAMRK